MVTSVVQSSLSVPVVKPLQVVKAPVMGTVTSPPLATPLPQTHTPNWVDRALNMAVHLDTKVTPKLLYPILKRFNPRLTLDDVILSVKGNPYSLSNTLFRLKYPRLLGVHVYGSARPTKNNALSHHYQLGLQTGKALIENGLFPVTGGGPGVMQAVAEGAYMANGHTVGVAVPSLGEMNRTDTGQKKSTAFEDDPLNIYRELVVNPTFTHRLKGPGGFFHRAGRILILPGGLGTIREALEAYEELAYSDQLSHFPMQRQVVILDQNGYYRKSLKPFLDQLIKEGTSSPKIYQYLRFVSSLPEAIQALNDPTVPWTNGLQRHSQRNLKYKSFSLSALGERVFHALHLDAIKSQTV